MAFYTQCLGLYTLPRSLQTVWVSTHCLGLDRRSGSLQTAWVSTDGLGLCKRPASLQTAWVSTDGLGLHAWVSAIRCQNNLNNYYIFLPILNAGNTFINKSFINAGLLLLKPRYMDKVRYAKVKHKENYFA